MNNSTIHMWFPTSIYEAKEIISRDENEKLIKTSLDIKERVPSGGENWNCNIYNTLETHDLINDDNFQNLINVITQHVDEYIRAYGSDHKYKCFEGWINVGSTGTYQEFHTHPNSTISAVYYAKMPEGGGSIVFENPVEPDMLPIKGIKENNNLNFKSAKYNPDQGTLLLFRSYLRHMVMVGTNKDPRITFAFNFN